MQTCGRMETSGHKEQKSTYLIQLPLSVCSAFSPQSTTKVLLPQLKNNLSAKSNPIHFKSLKCYYPP